MWNHQTLSHVKRWGADMSLPLMIDMLRHGETVKGQCFLGSTDAELTATGWSQMAQTLRDISPADYDLIVSSPLTRCKAFAEYWVAAHVSGQNTLRIEPAIREYDFGRWDGLTAAEIMQHWPVALGDFWRNPESFPPPGAELLFLFFQRLQRFVDNERQSTHKRILLITHGGVIKALTCLQQGLPASDMVSISANHGELHRIVWDRSL